MLCDLKLLKVGMFLLGGDSLTICVKPNTIAGGYKHTCFKPPENDGGLAQLAGNKMKSQEVTNRGVYNKMQLQEITNTLVLNLRRKTAEYLFTLPRLMAAVSVFNNFYIFLFIC